MESCGELQHRNRRGNRHCDRQNPVIYLITLRRTQTNLWGCSSTRTSYATEDTFVVVSF